MMSLAMEGAEPTAPAAARPAARFYRPELDVLRFVAFVLVFCHHLLPDTVPDTYSPLVQNLLLTLKFSAGNGLNLFFLLSSYLITELLMRERESAGTIHMKAFYVRRILRIWPLYFAFLLLGGYALGRVVPVLHISIPFLLQYIFLVGNLAFYHTPTMSPIGPLWSISVEEQFYLCWPFLARWGGRRALLWVSLGLVPLSMLSSAWLAFHAVHPGFAIWTHSFTEFECFGAGGLLALWLHRTEWRIGAAARAGLVVLCAAAWFISDGVLHYKRDQMVPSHDLLMQVGGFQLVIVGCVFLFLAMLGMRVSEWMKPLTYLGRISYGLYVFHILCRYIAMRIFSLLHIPNFKEVGMTNAALLLLAFALTVAMASVSYQFYEKPFLRLKGKFTYVRNRVD